MPPTPPTVTSRDGVGALPGVHLSECGVRAGGGLTWRRWGSAPPCFLAPPPLASCIAKPSFAGGGGGEGLACLGGWGSCWMPGWGGGRPARRQAGRFPPASTCMLGGLRLLLQGSEGGGERFPIGGGEVREGPNINIHHEYWVEGGPPPPARHTSTLRKGVFRFPPPPNVLERFLEHLDSGTGV